jgi:hypothetical protein
MEFSKRYLTHILSITVLDIRSSLEYPPFRYAGYTKHDLIQLYNSIMDIDIDIPPVKAIRDKNLRANMKSLETKYKASVMKLKDAEILNETTAGFLEPENDLERTYNVQQRDIHSAVSVETAKKGKFELKLDQLGPYVADYTRNGRELLLAGRKGHIATMDWREGKLGCELQLGETVRDAKWLHNNQMFAVSQKKYVYIYDRAGVELHCLKKHIEVTNMEFLPYHYLLATVVRIPASSPLNYTNFIIGQCWISEISRRFYRSSRHRNTYTIRISHGPHTKST